MVIAPVEQDAAVEEDPAEHNRLALEELEVTIEAGLAVFVEVGEALLAIRDGRLYKVAGHKSFDAYCRERWGMQRARADQLIRAHKVIGELAAELDTGVSSFVAPSNEAQLRELARHPETERAAIWQAAATEHGADVSAEGIRQTATQLAAPAPEPSPAQPTVVAVVGSQIEPDDTIDPDEGVRAGHARERHQAAEIVGVVHWDLPPRDGTAAASLCGTLRSVCSPTKLSVTLSCEDRRFWDRASSSPDAFTQEAVALAQQVLTLLAESDLGGE
jgi:hypothetical protein